MTERTLPPSSDDALTTRMRAARAALEQADQHPGFETLAALVDRMLPAAEADLANRHVADCPVCAEDLEDLRQTRAALAQWRGRPRQVFWKAAAIFIVGAAGLTWWVMQRTSTPLQTIVQQASQPAPSSGAPQVILRDGELRVSIASDGTVAGLDRLAASDAAMLSDLIKTRRLPSAKIVGELRPVAGALMGGSKTGAATESATFAVMGPIGTVVSDDRPTFRWAALNGATSYRVSVFDTRLNLVAGSGPIAGVQWTPAKPLVRGSVFVWQVEAVTSKGTVLTPQAGSPEARFSVISESDQVTLQTDRARLGASHLALAALYSRFGLIDDARNELAALAQENPGSTLVADLMAQLKSPTTRLP